MDSNPRPFRKREGCFLGHSFRVDRSKSPDCAGDISFRRVIQVSTIRGMFQARDRLPGPFFNGIPSFRFFIGAGDSVLVEITLKNDDVGAGLICDLVIGLPRVSSDQIDNGECLG